MFEITVLLLSHNKPKLVNEAINSVLGQSFTHWQMVLIDSGVLYDQGHFDWLARDSRIKVWRSTETNEIRTQRCVASWCFNQAFALNMVQGKVTQYLCDDDLLYGNALLKIVEWYQTHPEAMALICSEDVGRIDKDDKRYLVGERCANCERGQGQFLRIIDYLQFTHRREVWDFVQHDESFENRTHADGIFMEEVAKQFKIHSLDYKVGINRKTPFSLNCPT